LRSVIATLVLLAAMLGFAPRVGASFAQGTGTVTFEVNSTAYTLADAKDLDLSDNLCLTKNGDCALRAAIEQANAMAGDPSTDVVITVADSLPAGSTINGSYLVTSSTSPGMLTQAPTGASGDTGAWYHIKASMTIDLRYRLGTYTSSTTNTGTVFYIDAENVTVTNIPNTRFNESLFVIGAAAKNVIIDGFDLVQTGSNAGERFATIIGGAQNVTIRNGRVGHLDTGGGGAIALRQYPSDTSRAVTGLRVANVEFDDRSSGSGCSSSSAANCHSQAINTPGSAVPVTGMTVEDSSFQGHSGTEAINLEASILTGLTLVRSNFTDTSNSSGHAVALPEGFDTVTVTDVTFTNSSHSSSGLIGATSGSGSSRTNLTVTAVTATNCTAEGVVVLKGSAPTANVAVDRVATLGTANRTGILLISTSQSVSDVSVTRVKAVGATMPTSSSSRGAVSIVGTASAGSLSRLTVKDSVFDSLNGAAVTIKKTPISAVTIAGNTAAWISGAPTLWFNASDTGSLSGLRIVDNKVLNNERSSDIYTGSITIDARDGSDNIVAHNIIDNTGYTGSGTQQGIFVYRHRLSTTADSGMTISDNYIDGFNGHGIALYRSGMVTVERTRFGPNSSTAGGTAEVNEETYDTINGAGLFDNHEYTNRQIEAWYPLSATVDQTTCQVAVNVATGNAATAPVLIDAYWTAAKHAEVYLGSATLAAPGLVTVPYTVGQAGYLRLQTHSVPASGRAGSSQYSRLVPVGASACAPGVTVDQAPTQEDPTIQRDIRFWLRTSAPLAKSQESVIAAAADTTASTGANPQITQVRQWSATLYEVTGRVATAGTLVLALPAGSAATANGSQLPASTSTDNEVTYLFPFTLTPVEPITIAEDETPAASFTAAAAVPNWPTTLTITPDLVGVLALSSAEMTVRTSQADTVHLTAPQDGIHTGNRLVTLALSFPETDPELGGLIMPTIMVNVIDTTPPPSVSVEKLAWIGVSAGPNATYDQILQDPDAVQVDPEQILPTGTRVWWTYTITNTGGGALSSVTLEDDRLGRLDCPAIDVLPEGGEPVGCAASDLVTGAHLHS
jgi:hypothetical protein